VLDLPDAGKSAALNAGDTAVAGFPRVFLDADVVIGTDGMRALCAALAAAEEDPAAKVLAVAPRREVDVSQSPPLVRAYFAINSRLPVFQNALFGRGVIALSATGRARFDRFPDIVADDLFLDSLFSATEKQEVESVSARVTAPRRTRSLLRRLVRVRRGNTEVRALTASADAQAEPGRESRMSWLRDVALRNPRLAPAAAWYAAITITAALLAKLPQRSGQAWGRDDSSRQEDQ
jgi:hypothetical protein